MGSDRGALTVIPRTVITTFGLIVLALITLACDERDADPTPRPATATATPSPTSGPVPSPSATSTPVTDITRVSVPRGGTTTGEWGLVTGNKLTGGAEVWLMPDGTAPSGISPSGRFFAWGDSLFDGWTGVRTKISDPPDAIHLTSFAPDEQHVYVQDAAGGGRLLRVDGTEVARLPDMAGQPAPHASQLNVVWSADSRGVAVTRYADGTSRVDVVVDGSLVAPAIESNGMAGWSHAGLRLAVTGDHPQIYDFERGSSLTLTRGGGYPSWSGDDRYVALTLDGGEVPGIGVLDAATGEELLRVYEVTACFDIFWTGSLLLPGWEHAVEVESASFVERPDSPQEPEYPYFQIEDGLARWQDATGVYAEARVSGIWAASFSWTRRDVDNWPPVLMLGLGGKDACLGQRQPILVTPPFTAERIPVATPTPDK